MAKPLLRLFKYSRPIFLFFSHLQFLCGGWICYLWNDVSLHWPHCRVWRQSLAKVTSNNFLRQNYSETLAENRVFFKIKQEIPHKGTPYLMARGCFRLCGRPHKNWKIRVPHPVVWDLSWCFISLCFRRTRGVNEPSTLVTTRSSRAKQASSYKFVTSRVKEFVGYERAKKYHQACESNDLARTSLLRAEAKIMPSLPNLPVPLSLLRSKYAAVSSVCLVHLLTVTDFVRCSISHAGRLSYLISN